jgi:hypothetical protein
MKEENDQKLAKILAESRYENVSNNNSELEALLSKIETELSELQPAINIERKKLIFKDMAASIINALSEYTNAPIRDSINEHGSLPIVLQEFFKNIDEQQQPLELIRDGIQQGYITDLLNNPKFHDLVERHFDSEDAQQFLKGRVLGFNFSNVQSLSHRLFVVAKVNIGNNANSHQSIITSVPAPTTPMLFRMTAMTYLRQQLGKDVNIDILYASNSVPKNFNVSAIERGAMIDGEIVTLSSVSKISNSTKLGKYDSAQPSGSTPLPSPAQEVELELEPSTNLNMQ